MRCATKLASVVALLAPSLGVGNCGYSPSASTEASLAALRTIEAELAVEGPSYAQLGAGTGLRPSGGVVASRHGVQGVWLFGSDSGRVGWLPLDDSPARTAGRLQLTVDTGLSTTNCAAITTGLLCAGPGAPGVFAITDPASRASDASPNTPQTPAPQTPTLHPLLARGGYRDPRVLGDTAYLLDPVESRYVQLALDAPHQPAPDAVGPLRLPGHALQAVAVGKDLAVVAASPPRLTLLHRASGQVSILSQRAPVRALAYDQQRKILWTVGPNPAPIRRAQGPIRGLYSVLLGFAVDGPQDRAKVRVDLRQFGLIDATGVTLWQDAVVVVGTGSHSAVIYRPDAATGEAVQTGHGPAQPIATTAGVLIPNRLDESVTVISGTPTTPRTAHWPLGPPPAVRSNRARLGELLFYEKTLWSDAEDNRFTCNSCHWDLSSDHRMQPGIEESRWEMTRPLRGISMVAPIFTPMQSPSLTDAVEGLFTALDERHWAGLHTSTPIILELRDGPLQVSPHEARAALLTFLMTLKPLPGPLRRPDNTFSPQARAGAALFARDCAACHEPTASQRTRQVVEFPAALELLETQPLSFGAPLFAQTGVEPYFTSAGNRISPLLDLGRGGPFFSNGSAASLSEVIDRARPGSAAVHAPRQDAIPRHYSSDDAAALRAFLLSL